MVTAIQYLHETNIVHRDLKPENLLLCSTDDETNVLLKITDMGLSKDVTNSQMKTFCGTPQYISPEMLVNKVRKTGYDHKVDIWALGVILYTILTGIQPFRNERDDGKELLKQVLDCDFNFEDPIWETISDEAQDLVKKTIVYNYDKRLSAKQILQHPWMKDDEIIKKAESLMATQKRDVKEVSLKRSIMSIDDEDTVTLDCENNDINNSKRVRLEPNAEFNL